MQEALLALIADDEEIEEAATGGVWDHQAIEEAGFGREGLTLEVIQAKDEDENPLPIVAPSIFILWSSETPLYRVKTRSRSVMVHIYFYDQQSYETITAMRDRVYTLLHEQRISFDEDWYNREIRYAGGLLQFSDPKLNGTLAERVRYQLILTQDLAD